MRFVNWTSADGRAIPGVRYSWANPGSSRWMRLGTMVSQKPTTIQ